jgi:hypothetical protein
MEYTLIVGLPSGTIADTTRLCRFALPANAWLY